jgi:uncharacterized membrane protein HdeD (DUF308 family)
MKSKITKKSTGKMKYGDDGIASQFILLLIGVLSGFAFYNSIIQVLLIIPNIQRIISTYWLGLALLSLYCVNILCLYSSWARKGGSPEFMVGVLSAPTINSMFRLFDL